MSLKMIIRIDSKGIPPGLGQGEYPYYLYGYKPNKMLMKLIIRLDSKGIPPGLGHGHGSVIHFYNLKGVYLP